MTGLGAQFCGYLIPMRILGFYYMPIIFLGVGGLYTPPPGISGSTYAMKLKLTPGMMALNKKVH